MIKKLIFGDGRGSRKASDYQEQAHAMCREGLTNYLPVLLKTRDARGELSSVDMRLLEALHDIEKQLDPGQWLPSIEVYVTDRAFNVWVAYNGHEDAVGLYTYRMDPFSSGQEVEVNVRKWIGQKDKSKGKWKDAVIISCLPTGDYETSIGIFSANAIRGKSRK